MKKQVNFTHEQKRSRSVGIDLEIIQMIEVADKDNKTVLTAFHMFKLKELNMLIGATKDIKIHSNRTSRDENYRACEV